MNLILFDPSEVPESLCVILPPKDRRAVHMRTVLKLLVGDVFRAGVLGGSLYQGRVLAVGESGEFHVELGSPRTPDPAADTEITLLIAFPRPKSMNRLLSIFAQLGIKQIIVCGAERVEKSFFGSHITDPVHVRDALVKGLEQAAVSTRLPEVFFVPGTLKDALARVKKFADPKVAMLKLLAHPYEAKELGEVVRSEISSNFQAVTVALGPEGGWLDHEIETLVGSEDFRCVTFSPRILTTEVAVISMIAALNEALKLHARP